jgi:hypothetical protein
VQGQQMRRGSARDAGLMIQVQGQSHAPQVEASGGIDDLWCRLEVVLQGVPGGHVVS